ncbi:hypothetical protein ACQ4WP_28910 [Janthinobacterium sp. GB4P2]|uniref:hypothetical protein n=1 Tax=Janthinobacterium sp. GB4P2 TaxID=3424189 RepID=UPI003F2344D7
MDGKITARSITAKQMGELAMAMLASGAHWNPFKVENPEVFWDVRVAAHRTRVDVSGNYMLVLSLSRRDLLAKAAMLGLI